AHDVRSLQALDARLNEQVMQSRQSLVTHYDDLAHTVTSLRELHQSLEKPPAFLPSADQGTVAGAVKASAEALADKTRLVEAFKSQNAVFRNSARFFPVATELFRDRLRADPEGSSVAPLANEVLISVLHYVQLPSDEQLARAKQATEALRTAAVPSSFERDKEIVLVHAATVLERSSKLADLTNAVLTASTPEAAVNVDASYARGVHAAAVAAERRSSFMFTTLLAAVGLMAADFVSRYRRAARVDREIAAKLSAANEALLREKERETELVDLKSRFVSMTSHEFRTPLAVILSSAELLEAYGERWTPTKRSDHYMRIKGAVGNMRELLDAVLVIGRSDAGKLECNPGPMDLARFVRESVEAVASTSLRHELRCEIAESLPEAEIDEKLAVHVLTNLLSNAVKYSPAGGPVDVKVKADRADLVLEVTDRGIGISKDDQVRLFESFHRGKNVGTIPGTGLGLAVVKRAVDAHGGTIAVRSEEGEGTTFVVRLPVFRPDEPPPAKLDQRDAVRTPSRPEPETSVV
ncbi:MAG: HAMP domain-containing histidine kinase, partial [Polyangiaceae bacterium]|nr:HAMP domain-containing histidine kinase [Polyangiaceae bacterium]